MRTSDFDYRLPQRLIAQIPAEPRDSSRLLVLHKSTGHVEHRRFFDLTDYLVEGDLLVLNDSRVIPARLYGRRRDTGGKVEILLLHRLNSGVWRVLARPGRSMKLGTIVDIDSQGDSGVTAEVLESSIDGMAAVRLSDEEQAFRAGHAPLPPYIHFLPSDHERYQTVYSRVDGSAAAPTAGLHFTPDLLDRLKGMGVRLAYVTLHVGVDTFRPLRSEDPQDHKIHGEYYVLEQAATDQLNAARRDRRRIIAVGTTSVRLLEKIVLGAADGPGSAIRPAEGWAHLYILPGHQFRLVDAMITNFHLPRTTLLMLVSAFAGRDLVLHAYEEAIRHDYRFYSFGDGMLIV